MSRITDIAKTMKTWWDEDDNPLVHLALNEIIRIDQEQLPTIEPKRGKADRPQEWIPCSERLPKENTEVLMSLEWGIDIGECRNGDWHSEWINHYDDGNVLAWMPLPKPWKGADDETN